MDIRKYLKIFDIGLQNTVVYRWNFLLRSLFDVVPLAGHGLPVARAVRLAPGQPIGGYEFHSMVYYFLLTIAGLQPHHARPTTNGRSPSDIRDGPDQRAARSSRLNYLDYRISLFLGYRAIYSAFTLPLVLVFFACFHAYVSLPQHAVTWLWAALSLGLAAALQFFLAYAVAMLAFWLLEISTVVFIILLVRIFPERSPVPARPGSRRGSRGDPRMAAVHLRAVFPGGRVSGKDAGRRCCSRD